MHDILARVTLPMVSGLPEDAAVNTFAFRKDAGDMTATDLGAVAAAVEGFYIGTPPGSVYPIGNFLSNDVSRAASAVRIDLYDINAGGSEVFTSTFTLPATLESTDLPPEVAVCLSFHGNLTGVSEVISLPPTGPEGDVKPRSRLRGRVFLGPLNTRANSDGRVNPDFITEIWRKAAALRDNGNLNTLGIDWCVKSEATGAPILNPVTGGWVDNAFDTQRRRGVKASSRVTW